MMYDLVYKWGLVKDLKGKEWDGLGKGYNGGGQKDNKQEEKVRNRYEKFKEKV